MPRYYFDTVRQDLAKQMITLEREPNKGRGAYRLQDALEGPNAWIWCDTLVEVKNAAQGIERERERQGVVVLHGIVCRGDSRAGRFQVVCRQYPDGGLVASTVFCRANDWARLVWLFSDKAKRDGLELVSLEAC